MASVKHHGGGARAAGLELADEELPIFGDPRRGTLLMQDDPEIGYELPLSPRRPQAPMPGRAGAGEPPGALRGPGTGCSERLVRVISSPRAADRHRATKNVIAASHAIGIRMKSISYQMGGSGRMT